MPYRNFRYPEVAFFVAVRCENLIQSLQNSVSMFSLRYDG
jgi:hypothetical protein